MLGHLNYLDLTPESRAEAATKARATLRAALANPTTTQEQRVLIQERISVLNQWALGTLPTTKPENG